ncbi:MAG: family 16 glycoside hydrolase [Prosthecobacter sp.]|uniref:family 16 glycoside hydrolase n=1 Tax=Prosthecobacter sp. TaxID=1965333 RepID=UPI0038FD842A
MNSDAPASENDPNLSGLGRALLATNEGSKPTGPWVPPTAEELHQILPQYEIVKMLGRGGMGAVYMGRQTSLERPIAIKILSAQLEESDMGFTERFKNEAKAMAKLNHPGIVSVYDFGTTPAGLLYIVMEYVDGTDVARMIAKSGRLHTEHAMAITAHVCDALAYAHERGIIHRDIKPANIMVGYDGEVKVADFGLAKVNTGGSTLGLTMSGMAMGTLHYMAPESLMLGTAVDHRADIYAVGVMLYQMLTGKLPQGMFKMPSLLVAGLDPRYDGIIAKGIMEDREARYQSAREMRADLDSILTQPVIKVETPAPLASTPAAVLPTQARPQRPGGRAPAHAAATSAQTLSHERRRGSLTWLWVTMLVLAVLGGVGWFMFGTPKQEVVVTPQPPASSTPSATVITEKTAVTAPPAATTPNPLPPGWISLFNGKDLSGWELHPSNFPADVQDGAVRIRGSSTIPLSGNMYYRGTDTALPQWTDFELICTVKTENKGNSGIYLHATPGTPDKNRAMGVEVQILNDSATSSKARNPGTQSGGLQRLADAPVTFQDGEWFQVKVRVEGKRVQTWLKRPHDTDWRWQSAADWTQPAAWTPPPDRPGLQLGSGTISLQNNPPIDGVVWFKDIQFRVLNAPPAQTAAVTSAASTPPAPGPDVLEFTAADPVSGWSFTSTRGARWPEVDAVGQGHAILESTDETVHPNNNMLAPRLLRDVTGDFTLETWLDFSGGSPNKFAGSGLLLWQDDMNFIRLERIYADWQKVRHGISLQGRVNGVYKYWVDTDTIPTQATHVELRLERKGGLITASWLDSGKNWLPVGSVDVFWPAKIQAGIVTTALRGGPVVKTRFDRVSLTAAPVTQPVIAVSPAAPAITTLIETFGGHRYQFVPGSFTWQEAKTKAESMGGHLATVTSKEENDWLLLTYKNLLPAVNRNIWLGAIESASGAGWKWVTGEPFAFTGWVENEPNGVKGGGGQVGHPFMLNLYSFRETVGWNDSSTHFSQSRDNIGFIIEWEPAAPATTAPSPVASPTLWIDTKGRTLQAKFVRVEGGNVALDIAGKTTPVPLATLSAASQQIAQTLQASLSAPASKIPSDALAFGTSRYAYFPVTLTWAAAKAMAEAKGGHLATFTSATEEAAVTAHLQSRLTGQELLHFWLGGYQASATDSWAWLTGEPFTHTHWAPSEPDNSGGAGERGIAPFVLDCLIDKAGARWHDFSSAQTNWQKINTGYLVEWDNVASASTTPTPPAAQTATAVTPAPVEAGFISLLDADQPGDWVQVGPGKMDLQNGLATTSSPIKWGVAIYSKRTFADFVLKAEFKGVNSVFNSGLWLRIADLRNDIVKATDSRYEVGIVHSGGDQGRFTGTIWGVQSARLDALKANDWNELEITVTGQRYVVKLNGQLVNDFTGNKGVSGYIGLEENFAGPVQFRNVRVKPLP